MKADDLKEEPMGDHVRTILVIGATAKFLAACASWSDTDQKRLNPLSDDFLDSLNDSNSKWESVVLKRIGKFIHQRPMTHEERKQLIQETITLAQEILDGKIKV